MKKKLNLNKILIYTFITSVVLMSSIIMCFAYYNKSNDNIVNISNLSEDFMSNYLEESNKIEENEKDNILIITSKENIKNSYGASEIIEAPNNQYILKYDSLEEKNNAKTKLSEDKYVLNVNENDIHTIDIADTNTYNSWGVQSMGFDYSNIELKKEQISSRLQDVIVAIIDTGVDVDLANKYYNGKIAETYNVLEKSNSIMSDEIGHGTHIFGTIAESTPDNVKIMPVKASKTSSLYTTDIIEAINYITFYNKADVINMSFGSYYLNEAEKSAIDGAKQKNIICVASAGNDNTNQMFYPGGFDSTISIASVDSNLNKSSFSNFGSTIDFTAPGTNIKSIMSSKAQISIDNGNSDGDDDHETISGTSMATPHGVAAVAILKSFNKNLTFEQIKTLLKKRTIDLGTYGWDEKYGNGLVNFKNVEFCDGKECDEFGVFKGKPEIKFERMEVQQSLADALLLRYNYETLNNLDQIPVNVYDTVGESHQYNLGFLEGIEISGYDPHILHEQNVTIRWNGLETSFKVTNVKESGWVYKIIDGNNIQITGYKDGYEPLVKNTVNKFYIPNIIDGHNVVAIGNEIAEKNLFFDNFNKHNYNEVVFLGDIEIKENNLFSKFVNLNKIDATNKNIKIVGNDVFSNLTLLEETFGTFELIGNSNFEGDYKLLHIKLNDNMTKIPMSSFGGCRNLKEINMPSKLEVISDLAFGMCLNLHNIVIPNKVTTIGSYAFNHVDFDNLLLPNNLQSIGDMSFEASNINKLYIPNSLTNISNNAFYNSKINYISVGELNANYDSRENCNALIETKTNTLILGSTNTIIPSSILKIGSSAFEDNKRLLKMIIPDGVIEIGENAFNSCSYLQYIKIPRSVTTIGSNAFRNSGTILANNDSYAKTYAINNKLNYQSLEFEVYENLNKNSYKAFDNVDINKDIDSIMLLYDVGKLVNNEYNIISKPLEAPKNYNVTYINGDSFKFGDTHYLLKGKDVYDTAYEKEIPVTISKAIPTYTIPQGLKANSGQKLSEILLPKNFEWMNPEQIIEGNGSMNYNAKFIPEDNINYQIVENISIPISVTNTKEIIIPNIEIKDKTFDNSNKLDINNILISNLNTIDYTIESIKTENVNAGLATAFISLKLSDEKYKDYAFDNYSNIKEFEIKYNINPLKIDKPSLEDAKYVYNKSEHILKVINFQDDKMVIENNKQTNAGNYDVIIKLLNNNYAWMDGTQDNIVLKFNIEKANPDIIDKIPKNVSAKIGTTLSSVVLPKNFYWMNENQKIEELGTITFLAKYVPDDINNYNIIENININVNVDNKFKIYYHSNNNSNKIISKDIIYGDLINIEKNSFVYTGFEFVNWNTQKDGNGLKWSFGDSIKVLGDINLYAQWKKTDLKPEYIIENYEVDNNKNYINKIKYNTTLEEFMKNIKLQPSYRVEVDTINNLVHTGGKTKIFKDNKLIKEFTNIVTGDVNGNGKIDIIDYIRIMRHIMDTKKLDEPYTISADVNINGKVDIIDYIKIMKRIMEEN